MAVTYICGGSGEDMKRSVQELTCAIAASGTASDAVPTGGAAFGTFQIPGTFTGTTVTVQYSGDGTTFTEVNESVDETNPITVAANGTYWIPCQAFGAKYFRLVSGSSEAGARTIRVHMKG